MMEGSRLQGADMGNERVERWCAWWTWDSVAASQETRRAWMPRGQYARLGEAYDFGETRPAMHC